jgi:hypothetical protein
MKNIRLGLWIMLITAGIGIKACEEVATQDPALLAEEIALTTSAQKQQFVGKFKNLETRIKKANTFEDIKVLLKELFTITDEYFTALLSKPASDDFKDYLEDSRSEQMQFKEGIEASLWGLSVSEARTVKAAFQKDSFERELFEELQHSIQYMVACIIKQFEIMVHRQQAG